MIKLIAMVVVAVSLTACGGASKKEIAKCEANGITYMKAIGSYPRLSTTGELTVDAVKGRCQRAPLTAFTDDIVAMGKEMGRLDK
jgi:hypothetical protein